MALNSKFVVLKIDGELHLILGKCVFHRELAGNEKWVISGGWWELDTSSKVITFYGKSDQFGRASFDEVQECITNKNVFGDRGRTRNLMDEFSFEYRDSGGSTTKIR